MRGELPLADVEPQALVAVLARNIDERLRPRMGCVINLSGTVIHTNLGRSILADSALQHLLATMTGPNNLEYDLVTGDRGDRDSIVEELLCQLTGAQAATVVNNNAAAVLLTIAALAQRHAAGREVIISRGELVEIGGAFRMPDVMACAGASMVEVGTTNRTHPRDYAEAINERTALLMKVHTSNYVVQGFASAVDEATLAGIAHARGLPMATDLGSGALVDLTVWGLPHEPTPQEMIKAGSDVVTFSGDKLLGGPQAGLIVGTRAAVDCIRKFPMKRALRIGKLPLAALEATLRLYLRPERLARDLPTLRMLTRPEAEIAAMAERVAPAVAGALTPRFAVTTSKMMSQIGSGALPVDLLPSAGLVITPAGVARKGHGYGAGGTGRGSARLADSGDRPHCGQHAPAGPAHPGRSRGLPGAAPGLAGPDDSPMITAMEARERSSACEAEARAAENVVAGGESILVGRPGFKPGGWRCAPPGGFDSHSPPPA